MKKTKGEIANIDKNLGGAPSIDGYNDPEYDAAKSLAINGLQAEEHVTVQNPITGKKTDIVIRRDGTPESELAIAMADGEMDREKKDAILGMYLWERGKQSASFFTELMLYKGTHAKETQAFKKQMRFDFEMFVDTFCRYLHGQADAVARALGLMGLDNMLKEYIAYSKEHHKEGEPLSYNDVLAFKGEEQLPPERLALVELALRLTDQADMITHTVQKITENRMREKGFGIYIDKSGRPYSIFDDEIVDVVKKDVEARDELKKEHDNGSDSDS